MQHAIRWVDFPHSWVVLSYNQSTQIAPPNDDCKRGGVVSSVANWRPGKFWASHLRAMRSGWKAALASFLKIKSKILRRWNVLYAFLCQIKCFYNARCNTAKCVTSLRGPSPSYCTAIFKKMLQRWQTVGNTVCPRFEPQTSRSIDERATNRLTSV